MSYPGENGSCPTFHPICSLLCCLRRTRWGFPVLISLCMCGLCMLTLSTQILDVYIILLVAFLNPNFWTAVACSTVTSESFAIIAAEQRSPYLVKLSLLYGYQGLFWQNIFNSFCSTKVLRGRVLINMLYIKHECNAPAFCAGWSGCTSALGLSTHLSNWKDCLPLFSLCVCEGLICNENKVIQSQPCSRDPKYATQSQKCITFIYGNKVPKESYDVIEVSH